MGSHDTSHNQQMKCVTGSINLSCHLRITPKGHDTQAWSWGSYYLCQPKCLWNFWCYWSQMCFYLFNSINHSQWWFANRIKVHIMQSWWSCFIHLMDFTQKVVNKGYAAHNGQIFVINKMDAWNWASHVSIFTLQMAEHRFSLQIFKFQWWYGCVKKHWL